MDGVKVWHRGRFNERESVVYLGEKAGRRALDTHHDHSLILAAGPSLLVSPMDHTARKILSSCFFLSFSILFNSAFR